MSNKPAKRPLIIIDGMNVFLRHFMANDSINNKSEPVGGVVGFLKFLDSLVYRWSPGKLIVVWESGGPSSRRKKLLPEYKANRNKPKTIHSMKDQLRYDESNKINQLATLYHILQKTPVCQIYVKNTECDDVIGYLVKYTFRNENRMKLLVSSDKDFYQLLDDSNLKIWDPAKKSTIDSKHVLETYNIAPRNFCLARSLVGDVSDNIHGIPGVGLKTVSKRFSGFDNINMDVTINNILEQCRNILKSKEGKKLKAPASILENEDILRRNWQLMYLSSNTLSASQIQKIEGSISQHDPKMDKLGLLKEISKAGINISFDYNRFSSLMKQNLLFD